MQGSIRSPGLSELCGGKELSLFADQLRPSVSQEPINEVEMLGDASVEMGTEPRY